MLKYFDCNFNEKATKWLQMNFENLLMNTIN